MSDITIRKMNINKEELRNCALCDCPSSSTKCNEMYQISSKSFESYSLSEKPCIYLCDKCLEETRRS